MPRGIPNNSIRAGGRLGPSENTQKLLDAMADLKARLEAEKRKDTARILLLRFAAKHSLTANDLREAARRIGDRKIGAAPVVSHNIGTAKKLALGRKLKAAREAKGIPGTHLGKLVGAKSTAAVTQWEHGRLPSLQKYRDALIKHLDLPADFFAEAGPVNSKRGTWQREAKAKAKANGAAAHA
jgi:hypothetical protein